MIRQKIKLVVLFIILIDFSCIKLAFSSAGLLKTNKVNGRIYYHLQYKLTKNKFKVNKNYGFNEGGIFEIFIPKNLFPIPAPNCSKNIILRMPWTDEATEGAQRYIKEKKMLYHKLLNIGEEAQIVTIELNPYIKVNNGDVELTRCNVFFRHQNGRYIPDLK